ncbi:MAG: hypothetical protein LBK54_02615 [Propionibacteriaceae bacterium]|jgi:hypothetical protein|nr:hypothetical protein [Propionibacteriaceae bacterium]
MADTPEHQPLSELPPPTDGERGWYRDPLTPGRQIFWSGTAWEREAHAPAGVEPHPAAKPDSQSEPEAAPTLGGPPKSATVLAAGIVFSVIGVILLAVYAAQPLEVSTSYFGRAETSMTELATFALVAGIIASVAAMIALTTGIFRLASNLDRVAAKLLD